MSQYQIVSADIFMELLEVTFNNILYLRKFYPPETFVDKKIYGIATHVSQHPQVNEYLDNVLKTIRQWIVTDRSSVAAIKLNFIDKDKRLLENYVFDLSSLQDYKSFEKDPYFLETEQMLRNLCLKLSMAACNLVPLPDQSSFSINVETRQSACLTLSENPLSQSFPWIVDQGTTELTFDEDNCREKKSLFPLAIVRNLGLEIYVVVEIKQD